MKTASLKNFRVFLVFHSLKLRLQLRPCVARPPFCLSFGNNRKLSENSDQEIRYRTLWNHLVSETTVSYQKTQTKRSGTGPFGTTSTRTTFLRTLEVRHSEPNRYSVHNIWRKMHKLIISYKYISTLIQPYPLYPRLQLKLLYPILPGPAGPCPALPYLSPIQP